LECDRTVEDGRRPRGEEEEELLANVSEDDTVTVEEVIVAVFAVLDLDVGELGVLVPGVVDARSKRPYRYAFVADFDLVREELARLRFI
jgi:hypothetical protein